jgi:hypothetical protein
MLDRRSWALGVGSAAMGLFWGTEAYATTARGLSLEQLVRHSERVILGMPAEKTSAWELYRGSRRIVTTTRLLQEEEWLDGVARQEEVFITTLGGRVGDLGQKIPGEAHLREGEQCVLFVGPATEGRRRVVAMGQGHYPVSDDERLRKLRLSPSLPHLVGKRAGPDAPVRAQRAVDVLAGRSVSDARDLIRSVR